MHPRRSGAQFHQPFAHRVGIGRFRRDVQVAGQVVARAVGMVHLQVGQAAVAQRFGLVGQQLQHAVGAARGAVPLLAST